MSGYAKRLRELIALMRMIVSRYGRGSAFMLWCRLLMTVAQPRLPRMWRRAQPLDLVFAGEPFQMLMLDRTSLAAFEEVFIRREYSVPALSAPHRIVDVGANIGAASVYFLLRYPGARLYAIEPDPDVCEILRRNLAAFPEASVHQCALSDTDGTVDFHIHPSSSIASSIISRVSGERVMPVSSKTLDTFIHEENIASIDLLKFDIEGAEDRLLRGISDVRAVACYVGEIHPDLLGTSLEDIVSLFGGFAVTVEPVGTKRFLLTAVRK